MSKILRVVLTGGPCSGKTTALENVKEYFESKGYIVIQVSETPTDLMRQGLTYERFGKKLFQSAIIDMQIAKERIILNTAKTSKSDIIILYDRGVIDHFTYLTLEEQKDIELKLNIKKDDFYQEYDAVFHMQSTAIALPDIYTTTEYRLDTIETAAESDKLIEEFWKQHSYYKKISCTLEFEKKIKQLIGLIEEFILKTDLE